MTIKCSRCFCIFHFLSCCSRQLHLSPSSHRLRFSVPQFVHHCRGHKQIAIIRLNFEFRCEWISCVIKFFLIFVPLSQPVPDLMRPALHLFASRQCVLGQSNNILSLQLSIWLCTTVSSVALGIKSLCFKRFDHDV